MEYREIGKTGKKAGVIGLGCEHLDGAPYAQVQETVEAALEHGVNMFEMFMPGKEIRENVAKAMGPKRKDVMIQGHLCSTDVGQKYDISRDLPTAQKYFEDLLRIFGYVDFGMLFFIDSEKDFKSIFETDIITYMQKLKQNGDVHHIGFSSHNPAIATRVVETGLVESMLFSINLAFDMCPADRYALGEMEKNFDGVAFNGLDPERAALYTLCEQKGVGITVMKTLGAGKLLSAEHTPFKQPMTAAQCVHYALTRPAVSSVLLGCKTRAEVEDAMGYFAASDSQRDYTPFIGMGMDDFKGHCVYCSHCQPCPSDIDIATVNKYLDIARLTPGDVPASVRSHYKSLENGGDRCIECGSCEERCPFGVEIIRNMAEAVETFK